MHSLLPLLLPLLPLVLAAPQSPQEILVTWHHRKLTSKTSVHIYNHDSTALLGQAPCLDFNSTQTVDTGNFASSPITFSVDGDGFGTFKYGDTTYDTGSVRENSGEIDCTSSYSDSEATVECLVPWKGSELPTEAPMSDAWECEDTPQQETPDPELRLLPGVPGGPIDCSQVSETTRDGNGSPVKWTLRTQLSGVINCGELECQIGRSEVDSVTVKFSVKGKIAKWITGGFSVQQTRATGNSMGCSGKPGDKICLWYLMPHTAYKVKTISYPLNPKCGGGFRTEYASVTSPDKNGGEFLCVRNRCKTQGFKEWKLF